MDFGSFIEAGSSAVLNEILSSTHDRNGLAFPSRYDVLFLPPSGTRGTGGVGASTNLFSQTLLGQVGGGDIRDVSYQCNSIAFPGRNITVTEDVNIYGPTREIASGFTYGDITAKFYCHNDYREKKFFETWQRLAFNPQTFAMNYYDDYTGTIQIYQLDHKGNRTYGCELVECFPKNIGDQSLMGAQATAAMEVSVTFSYRYWKNLTDEASLPKPLLERLQGVLANQVERKLLSRIPKVLSRL
jgi:hypothetical protein